VAECGDRHYRGDPIPVHHLRLLHPADGIYAFYDGRIEGYRFADGSNWVDDGALSLGISSYAVVDGDEALIYDTHVSVEHARFIRNALEAEGVRHFIVLLSHRDLDHVAGTAVFADCEVIATARTAQLLVRDRRAIEAGALEGPPGIDPLILPTRTFEGRMRLDIGRRRLELVADSVDAGWINYFAPYEAVHQQHLEAVTAAAMGFIATFRYEVDPGLRDRFEQVYGAGGTWAEFFGAGTGYLGTDLYRSTEQDGAYLVVDRWSTEAAYRAFLDEHRAEYEWRNAEAAPLYRRELAVGRFTSVP
jgi:heme-degrading monooxygenase HmoA